MEEIVVDLFGDKIPLHGHGLAIRLVIDYLFTFPRREAYLSLRERCSKYLHLIALILVVRSNADCDGSCALHRLDHICIHQVAFHIQDTFQTFSKNLHFCCCVYGQYRRGKGSCKHIPLQVIQHYGIVLTEFICRYYALVRDSQVLIQ